MFRRKRKRTCNLKLSSNFRCIYFQVSPDISAESELGHGGVASNVYVYARVLYFGYFPLRRVNGARLVKSDGWCKIQRI